MSDVLAAHGDLAKTEAELAAANEELRLDLAQATLDMVGIADPTPVSDLLGAGLSLYRGDPLGAGASLLGVIPYVGDAIGKTAKGARLLKKIEAGRKRVAGLMAKANKLRAVQKAKAAAATAKATAERAVRAKALQECPFFRDAVAKASAFVPHGLSNAEVDGYLKSAEGKRFLERLAAGDPNATAQQIRARARGQLATMAERPKSVITESGLVKIVPSGGQVGHSPYFTTPEEFERAKASGRSLADYFGLPLKSESATYDVFEMTPMRPTEVLTGKIAPTSELATEHNTAGGLQVLVSNRADWHKPKKIGKFP
ncbi:hypothetical protein [Caulobacter endophyticus]|uniref:Uncharacterized protein n=1 Tax=Caulobacter endophyticus TaxID=2172652 RepID=A0A2T9JJD1_9CAUL|nr:hypothetical protein [Caulobacter endophyticus]PVM83803.1 hypothetical protein DDF67_20240 [Caulobacter endophyticus]